MKIKIIASDSFGARSMATCVIAGGHKILIDPGVALGPRRYGYPPHELEIKKREELAFLIREEAKDAEFVIVTHYHKDHYNAGEDVFYGKRVFIRDPENHINPRQKGRAKRLLSHIGNKAEITIADGMVYKKGSLEIIFSEPQPHGITTRVGWVIQVAIKEDDKVFLYTSDIQGAGRKEHMEFIQQFPGAIIFMDGPATYLSAKTFPKEDFESCLENMKKIIIDVKPRVFILDHHTTRDKNYREKLDELFKVADKKGVKIVSAAEFMGFPEEFLEANRKELYENRLQVNRV